MADWWAGAVHSQVETSAGAVSVTSPTCTLTLDTTLSGGIAVHIVLHAPKETRCVPDLSIHNTL